MQCSHSAGGGAAAGTLVVLSLAAAAGAAQLMCRLRRGYVAMGHKDGKRDRGTQCSSRCMRLKSGGRAYDADVKNHSIFLAV